MARLYDYSKWDKFDCDTDDASSSDDDDGEVVIENDWAEEDRPMQTVTDVAALADADDRRPPPPPEPVPNVVHGPELPPPPPPPPPLPRWEVDGLPATLVECEARDVENENARGELEELCRGFVWVPGIRGSQRGGFAPPAIRVETGPVAAAGAVAFATRAPDRLPSSKKDATRLAFAAALPHRAGPARLGAALGFDAPEFEGKTCRWGKADARRSSTAPNNREGGDVAQLAALVALRAMEADYGAAGAGVVDHFVRQAQAPPEPVRAPPQDGGVEEAKEEPPPRATGARAARSRRRLVGARRRGALLRGGDEDAGKGCNKGGPMSDDEVERFRAAVVGLEVAWARRAGAGASAADELRVRGFGSAGEAPTVAAWWRPSAAARRLARRRGRDLGAVPGGALERLRTIGWGDAAFDAAAATHRADEPDRILKFHQLLGAERHRAGVEPHDAACACFGSASTAWVQQVEPAARRRCLRPASTAFVAAARRGVADFRRHGLDPLAAFTESDEITFLFRGPATTAGGASDPRRRLETFAASVFTSAFAAALPGEMTDGGNDGFFDARSFAASSNAAGLAALVWRRLDTTRNASSQALRHLHDVTICVEIKSSTRLQSHWLISTQVTITPGNHKEQRGRLAALGTPWASLPPELRYGTLLLAGDDRTHNVRLRVPRTADEARVLDRVVFDEQRWTDAHGPHLRARV
ncbi:hypothetical protein JL721_8274 [Aureococcus anophagefferens]|nr:hypothetical protein JL721_8274 [Aureococcus anophagefferens]